MKPEKLGDVRVCETCVAGEKKYGGRRHPKPGRSCQSVAFPPFCPQKAWGERLMCWGPGVSATIVGIGVVATAVTVKRGTPLAFSVAIAWFTLMEALQFAGYLVINQCDNPVNQMVTLLSILHIVFQPFFINAFSLELVPAAVRRKARVPVYTLCGISSAIMLLQLYPFPWAGSCEPNVNMCGSPLCTVSGNWHLAWNVPYNGLMVGVDQMIGMKWGFPSYMFVSFLVPVLYGAWRFTVFHAIFGPLLAARLTGNVNEVPAVWCLFSLGLVLMALNPVFRQNFEWREDSAPRTGDGAG